MGCTESVNTLSPLVSSNGNRKRIAWFYAANPNPWNEDEPKEWKRYSDFENAFIEEAYQRQDDE
ncbi:unnamed protein product, partial [Rotaria sordida]